MLATFSKVLTLILLFDFNKYKPPFLLQYHFYKNVWHILIIIKCKLGRFLNLYFPHIYEWLIWDLLPKLGQKDCRNWGQLPAQAELNFGLNGSSTQEWNCLCLRAWVGTVPKGLNLGKFWFDSKPRFFSLEASVFLVYILKHTEKF